MWNLIFTPHVSFSTQRKNESRQSDVSGATQEFMFWFRPGNPAIRENN